MSVTRINSVPQWEVSDTTAYPVDIQRKNKPSIGVYAYLTPYASSELRSVLQQAVSGYRREKRDMEIEREDKSIYVPLFDAHFVKLGNSTGTPAEQKALFDSHPELKPGIIEYTFGGLRKDPPDESTTDNDVFDIAEDLAGVVSVYQDLYDDTVGKVVRVDMTHSHSHPTEAQYREYRSARRNRFVQKRALWTVSENHSILERLYDAVITSIGGITVKGQVCSPASKAAWIGEIPLWHKIWVVDHIFADLIEKNG